MSKVFIVAAKRTPVGSFGGALKTIPATQLAATAVKAAVAEAGVPVEAVDEVIMGNVIGAGLGQGPGRQVALLAGLPETVPGYSLNMVCGSGMKVVMDAAAHIRAGDADVVVACGGENMSQIPFAMKGAMRDGQKMGDVALQDLMLKDGLMDAFSDIHMGMTAENICAKYELTREEQDTFALASQQKAVAAIEAGYFKNEITPVEVASRRAVNVVDTDEYPKADATAEGLAKLRPAFKKDGSVTAGNASGLNDGGSAIIVASEAAVEKYGLTPIIEVVGYAQAGLSPEVMGLGPVPAIEKALAKSGVSLDQIGRLELNEAFAGQALGVARGLCETQGTTMAALAEKTNVNGGAIALGHPLGASGNRIMVTLIHELLRSDTEYGLASLCVGGGMGTAVILKKL